jgi:ABC-type sugar transport system ATPase subunit
VELSANEILPIQPPLDAPFRDKAVILGVRPEHFHLAEEGGSTMQMHVEHLETLGADTLVHGRSGGKDTLFTLRLSDIHRFQKGRRLPLSVSPEKIHLFDKKNGKRIGS